MTFSTARIVFKGLGWMPGRPVLTGMVVAVPRKACGVCLDGLGVGDEPVRNTRGYFARGLRSEGGADKVSKGVGCAWAMTADLC